MVTRFRFLAPGIAKAGGSVSFDLAQTDMLDLCQNYALPRVAGSLTSPTQIIISLSDRAVPFGQSDAEATQFFEAYTIEGNSCIWEVF